MVAPTEYHITLYFYYTPSVVVCQLSVFSIKFKLFVNFIKITRAGVVKYYYLCYNIYNYTHDTLF